MERGFRVGLNGVDAQKYLPNVPPVLPVYVPVQFNTLLEADETGGFNKDTWTWTAPAAGVLITGFQVWAAAGVGYGEGVVAKLKKNPGGLITKLDTAGIAALGFYPNTAPARGTMRYRVVEGDAFRIDIYCVGMNASPPVEIMINPRSEHTWWWGSFTADPS